MKPLHRHRTTLTTFLATSSARAQASLPVRLYHGAVARIIGASQAVHGWVAALFMASLLGVDALLHMFSIPHMENWWVPLVGGASANVIGGGLKKWRGRFAGK